MKKVIQPNNLQADSENLINNILPYLSGKSKTLHVTLDLSKYHQGLSDSFQPTVEKYLSSLPICDKTNDRFEGFPTCRQAGLTTKQLYDLSGAAVGKANIESAIPDKIVLSEDSLRFDQTTNQVSLEANKNLNLQKFKFSDLKKGLAIASSSILWLLLAGFFFVVLLFFLLRNEIKTALVFFCWALLGFVFFLPSGLIIFVFNNVDPNRFTRFNPSWSWASEAIYYFSKGFLRPLFFESLAIIVIAIVVLVLIQFFPKRKLI